MSTITDYYYLNNRPRLRQTKVTNRLFHRLYLFFLRVAIFFYTRSTVTEDTEITEEQNA